MRRGLEVCRELLTALVVSAVGTSAASAQTIRDYAQDCAQAMENYEVPAFNCMQGTVIPMVGVEGGTCDVPPYLPGAGCFQYSRIGELHTGRDSVKTVFLCRHKHPVQDENVNLWADVAVIVTHIQSGATCFFQKLDNMAESISGVVPKPDSPAGLAFWMAPNVMAQPGNACVQCHDNGAFLRTPYVMQVDVPALQNYNAQHRNIDNYNFPGNNLVHWNLQVNRVRITGGHTGQICTGCHRMGHSTINANQRVGTSKWLGLASTGAMPTAHIRNGLGPQQDRAVWMRPNIHALDDPNQAHSRAVDDCARHPLVTDGCANEPFGGQMEAVLKFLGQARQAK